MWLLRVCGDHVTYVYMCQSFWTEDAVWMNTETSRFFLCSQVLFKKRVCLNIFVNYTNLCVLIPWAPPVTGSRSARGRGGRSGTLEQELVVCSLSVGLGRIYSSINPLCCAPVWSRNRSASPSRPAAYRAAAPAETHTHTHTMMSNIACTLIRLFLINTSTQSNPACHEEERKPNNI